MHNYTVVNYYNITTINDGVIVIGGSLSSNNYLAFSCTYYRYHLVNKIKLCLYVFLNVLLHLQHC